MNKKYLCSFELSSKVFSLFVVKHKCSSLGISPLLSYWIIFVYSIFKFSRLISTLT
jgi:hypothetical protein